MAEAGVMQRDVWAPVRIGHEYGQRHGRKWRGQKWCSWQKRRSRSGGGDRGDGGGCDGCDGCVGKVVVVVVVGWD